MLKATRTTFPRSHIWWQICQGPSSLAAPAWGSGVPGWPCLGCCRLQPVVKQLSVCGSFPAQQGRWSARAVSSVLVSIPPACEALIISCFVKQSAPRLFSLCCSCQMKPTARFEMESLDRQQPKHCKAVSVCEISLPFWSAPNSSLLGWGAWRHVVRAACCLSHPAAARMGGTAPQPPRCSFIICRTNRNLAGLAAAGKASCLCSHLQPLRFFRSPLAEAGLNVGVGAGFIHAILLSVVCCCGFSSVFNPCRWTKPWRLDPGHLVGRSFGARRRELPRLLGDVLVWVAMWVKEGPWLGPAVVSGAHPADGHRWGFTDGDPAPFRDSCSCFGAAG